MLSAIHDRRPWFVALLSLFLTPAIGMAYLNRGWLAFLYLLLLIVIVALTPQFGAHYPQALAGVVTLAGMTHAVWIARWFDPSRALRWYARYWDWIALFALLAMTGLVAVRLFAFQPFHAASGSMSPSLNLGDHVLVSKYRERDFHLQHGDIVVFHNAATQANYIKRVVGLPGDSVQIQGGILFINGVRVSLQRLADVTEPCDEKICRVPQYEETLPGGHKARILKRAPFDDADSTDLHLLPAGSYFVLGDDRDNSADSRQFGPVARRDLVGRAVIRIIADGRWTWQPVR